MALLAAVRDGQLLLLVWTDDANSQKSDDDEWFKNRD
jgi:hypothetical protein